MGGLSGRAGRRVGGGSGATVRRSVAVMSAVMRTAARRGSGLGSPRQCLPMPSRGTRGEVWRLVDRGDGSMSSVSAERTEAVRCGATTGLTAIEAAKLRVNCRQVPALDAWLICELAAGHDGSRVAFATTADDGELW